ncbi:MAG: PIN domain-containing protein [Myxococcota bacterium]
MILVDTSIWIHLFSKNNSYHISQELLSQIMLCPPVVQEILQGIREDRAHMSIREALLAFPLIANSIKLEDYLFASEIYRLGREKGYTIRSSTDCLIAALAIGAKIPVWHRDRDFDFISRFTSLKIFNF